MYCEIYLYIHGSKDLYVEQYTTCMHAYHMKTIILLIETLSVLIME